MKSNETKLREKLKPCPFCGGDAKFKENHWFVWVECVRNCNEYMGMQRKEFAEQQYKHEYAAKVWNTRAQEDSAKLNAENIAFIDAHGDAVTHRDLYDQCDICKNKDDDLIILRTQLKAYEDALKSTCAVFAKNRSRMWVIKIFKEYLNEYLAKYEQRMRGDL